MARSSHLAATDEERRLFAIPGDTQVFEWAECPKHGRYPVKGVQTAGKDAFWVPFACGCVRCAQERAQTERFGRVAIPRRYENARVADYKVSCEAQRVAKAEVVDFCRNIGARLQHGDSLIFFGGSGTGKTFLACAIARRAVAEGFSALFIKARALVSDIRSSWRKDSCLTEKDVIDRFVGVDLLIIDEVGAQFGTPGEALHLFDVIGERYAQMKSTILLSNFPLTVTPEEKAAGMKGISDYLGDAVFDRFREAGSRAVAFSWNSYRGGQNQHAAGAAHRG